MFLAKLKLAVGAVVVLAALGASGLAYRAAGQAPAAPTRGGKGLTEVEALRRENELLKLNLEVVLEKVRAQEAEVRSLRAQLARRGHLDFDSSTNLRLPKAEASLLGKLEGTKYPDPDAGREAEAALKALREAKDDAARRRAVDELDHALRALRQHVPGAPDDYGPKRP